MSKKLMESQKAFFVSPWKFPFTAFLALGMPESFYFRYTRKKDFLFFLFFWLPESKWTAAVLPTALQTSAQICLQNNAGSYQWAFRLLNCVPLPFTAAHGIDWMAAVSHYLTTFLESICIFSWKYQVQRKIAHAHVHWDLIIHCLLWW